MAAVRTFSIETLGCKVNQYESEQIATLLRRRGLVQVESPSADVRIVNTCSVTMQAASKSRQLVRRSTRLPVLGTSVPAGSRRVIATGCWTTSNPSEAAELGVDAVLTHHQDVAAELDRLLESWNNTSNEAHTAEPSPKPLGDDGSITRAGTSARSLWDNNTPPTASPVKKICVGTRALPLLDARQESHQRAFLKIQDGCDAHCSYCIIPNLRPALWSKPLDDVIEEARRLVDVGHREIVLTGIFLGAYGQPTAIRRRQPPETARPLSRLVEALCTRVPGLRRLRFSSLEPGDLTPELLAVMRSHAQCVPHFHLPLQSGSDAILRRMNRQYTTYEFLRMIDDVHAAFDRPAITTDIIAGFPGETDDEFLRTLQVVDSVKFIHIHAFSFSPRPGTAAARWTRDFVRGPAVNERINILKQRSARHSYDFRRQFLGQSVELLIERPASGDTTPHGRSERYFEVHLNDEDARPGDVVNAVVNRVSPSRTWGARDPVSPRSTRSAPATTANRGSHRAPRYPASAARSWR